MWWIVQIPQSTIYTLNGLIKSERSSDFDSVQLRIYLEYKGQVIFSQTGFLLTAQSSFVQRHQSGIFTSHSWLAFQTLWTVSHRSRLHGCSSEPGSSVGQPRHSPLSRQLHCCLSHCSFAKKQRKKPHKPPQKKWCFCVNSSLKTQTHMHCE